MVVSQALAEIQGAPPRALLSEETGDHLLGLQAIFSWALSPGGGLAGLTLFPNLSLRPSWKLWAEKQG